MTDATTPHRLVNPSTMLTPKGFAHVALAGPGQTIYLGGQVGYRGDDLVGPDLIEQLDQALANVVEALAAAGGAPHHLVSVHLFVTDVAGYRASLAEAGTAWRRHLGSHYPAAALFEVKSLFDPAAKIELVCIAVLPEARAG